MGSKRQRRKTVQQAVRLKSLGKLLVFSQEEKSETVKGKTEETVLNEELITSHEIKEHKTETFAHSYLSQLQTTSSIDQDPYLPTSIEPASSEELFSQVTTAPIEQSSPTVSPYISLSERSQESRKMLKKILDKKIGKPDGEVFSSQEISCLEKVLIHRQLLSHFAELFTKVLTAPSEEKKEIVNTIIEEISQVLEKIEKGTLGIPCFSFPWIKGADHACFEFKKTESEKWMFTIHNRGHGIEDKELHGEIYLKIGSSLYGKTSVQIEIKKDATLKDQIFLHKLIDLYQGDGTIEDVYGLIKSHLLKKGKNKISISNKEKEVLETLKNTSNEEIAPLIEQLCQEDLCFDKIQRNGTKNNSSLTLPEKWLATPSLKKYLTLYSFIQQTTLFKQTIHFQEFSENSDPEILKKHRWFWKKEEKAVRALAAAA